MKRLSVRFKTSSGHVKASLINDSKYRANNMLYRMDRGQHVAETDSHHCPNLRSSVHRKGALP